ncbi:MAG: Maf family protein [Armatimonas sp.]
MASASPRRRQLLKLLGVRFSVVVSQFDEDSLKYLTDPAEYVQRAAEGKALEVARRRAGVILGVDTDVVGPQGQVLGKPKDAEDAHKMLSLLSDHTHSVLTAISLVESEGKTGGIVHQETHLIQTQVTFAALTDEAIGAYVATGDSLDKAGSYGFQGPALAFIARIDGDPSSVIGLPLAPVADLLRSRGVPLWNSLPR